MANFEDGSKFIIGFRPKAPKDQARNVFSPNVNIMIITPEGETRSDFLYYKAHEGSIAKERCEVKMGPHSAIGDLKDYDVHFEPVNGVGADLHYHFLVEPFRPGGTAYAARFILSLCYADGKTTTSIYDKLEYCSWRENDTEETVRWDLDYLIQEIINDLEGSVPTKLQAE